MVSGEEMTGLVAAGFGVTICTVALQALLVCISIVRRHPETGRLAFETPIHWIFGGGGLFPAVTFFLSFLVFVLMGGQLTLALALYNVAHGYDGGGLLYRSISFLCWGGCLVWVGRDLINKGVPLVSRQTVVKASFGLLVALVLCTGLMTPVAKNKIFFDPRLSTYTEGVASL